MNGHQLIELLRKQNLDLDVYCYVETCGCGGESPIQLVQEDDTLEVILGTGYTKRRVLLLRSKEDS
jgi:hypothetical protein